MFKYIKQYAETIDHAQIYPLFSLLVFFLFFVVLIFLVKKMDKKQVDKLSNIPFDQQDNPSVNI